MCKKKFQWPYVCRNELSNPRLQTAVRHLGLESSIRPTQRWLKLIILHPVALAPMLSYPTELLFWQQQQQYSWINYPFETTIIYRIIDGTLRLNHHTIQHTHLVNMCPSRRHPVKPWLSTFVLKAHTIFWTYVYSILPIRSCLWKP